MKTMVIKCAIAGLFLFGAVSCGDDGNDETPAAKVSGTYQGDVDEGPQPTNYQGNADVRRAADDDHVNLILNFNGQSDTIHAIGVTITSSSGEQVQAELILSISNSAIFTGSLTGDHLNFTYVGDNGIILFSGVKVD